MNEIILESPEKNSDIEDKNSYVPETPGKEAPYQEYSKIPIPSISRMRKSLSAINDNNILSPAKRKCAENINYSESESPKSTKRKNFKKNKSIDKVKVSLFHKNFKENEPKDFSLNIQSFYGSSNDLNEPFTLAPLNDTVQVKQTKRNSKKKQAPVLLIKKNKKGEINAGVSHGIKRPKRKRSSLNNDSIEKEEIHIDGFEKQSQISSKKIDNSVMDVTVTVEENVDNTAGVVNEEYDPTKKFFKHKNSNRTFKISPPSLAIKGKKGENSKSNKKCYSKSTGTKTNKQTIDNFRDQIVTNNQSTNLEIDHHSSSQFAENITVSSIKKDMNCDSIIQDNFNVSKSPKEIPVSKNFNNRSNSFKDVTVEQNVANNQCTNLEIDNDNSALSTISNIEKNLNCSSILQDDQNISISPNETLVPENCNQQLNSLKNLTEEQMICKKQNDIKDLLKILEDDWNDDDDAEVENFNNLSTSDNTSYIFKDVTLTHVIQNIFDNVVTRNNDNKVIEEVSKNLSDNTIDTQQTSEKLYPLFYKENISNIKFEDPTKNKQKETSRGQWKGSNDENQYQIDAGQKLFGAIQCKECNLIYHIGDKDDEKAHLKYHNSFQTLKFQGWKNERVVYEDSINATRIILIEPDDPNLHQNKVMEILNVVDKDLGLSDTELSNYKDKKVYLYIRDKTILGVLVAEHVKIGYKMIPELIDLNCCTSESSLVQCGINVVWTVRSHRRQGIATKLVDILRSNYYYGHILSVDDIAFSIPTPSGKLFAEKYTQTSSFKVY